VGKSGLVERKSPPKRQLGNKNIYTQRSNYFLMNLLCLSSLLTQIKGIGKSAIIYLLQRPTFSIVQKEKR